MNFTGLWNQTFTRNLTTRDAVDLLYGAVGGTPLRFTIGQPDDPKWKGDAATDGGRIVDAGTWFYLSRDWYNVRATAERRDEVAQGNWDRQEKKWKLGVGIGVGVGAPVLMIASYMLGQRVGKKKNPEAVALKAVNNEGL